MKLKINSKIKVLEFISGTIELPLIYKPNALDLPLPAEDVFCPPVYNLLKGSIEHMTSHDLTELKVSVKFDDGTYCLHINGNDDGDYLIRIEDEFSPGFIKNHKDALNKILLELKEIVLKKDYETIKKTIGLKVKDLSHINNDTSVFLFSWFEKVQYWSSDAIDVKDALMPILRSTNFPPGLSITNASLNTSSEGNSDSEYQLFHIKDSELKENYMCLGIQSTQASSKWLEEFQEEVKLFAYDFFFAIKKLHFLSLMPLELVQNPKLVNRSIKSNYSNTSTDFDFGQSNSDAICIHDLSGNIIQCNDLFREWTNCSKDNTNNLYDILITENKNKTIKEKIKTLASLAFKATIYSVKAKQSIPLMVYSNPMKFRGQTVYFTLLKNTQMIDFPKNNFEVKGFRDIISQLCVFSYGYRVDTKTSKYIFDWIQGSLEGIPFDQPSDMVENEIFMSFVHPEDFPIIFLKDEMISKRKSHVCFYRVKDNEGDYRWAKDYHWYIGETEDGMPEFIGAVQDLSSSVNSDYQMGLLKLAIDKSSNIIMIVNKNNMIEYANPALLIETGFDPSKVVGKDVSIISDLISLPYNLRKTIDTSDKLLFNQKVTFNKNGKKQDFYVSVTKVSIDNEKQAGKFVIIGQNITKLVQLEKHLIDRDKLNIIGLMTSGIAHDLMNILQIIESYTELIEFKSKFADPKLIDYMSKIHEALSRGSNLVTNILEYGKQDIFDSAEEIALNELINGALIFIKSNIPNNITIKTNFQEETFVIVQKIKFQQALINLLINSIDAIGINSGYIEITASKEFNTSNCHKLGTEECVLIEIKDNGKGISKDMLNKIFNPYFTTKQSNAGNNQKPKHYGLGLQIVESIVKDHEGSITVESEIDQWTKFSIILPHNKTSR